MTKAERIYKNTSVSIRRFLRGYKGIESNEKLDATKYIVQLVYDDDESISMRTLNDMMKILEWKEKNPYKDDDEITIMRNSINSRMEDIKEFRTFLKTL